MFKNKYLVLFEDCRIVEGYNRSIIYDLTKPKNSNEIPNSLVKVLNEFKMMSIENVLKSFDFDNRNIVIEYIDFLVENQFAIICDKYLKNRLQPISLKRQKPELIEDAILCINNENFEQAIHFIVQLEVHLCSRIEIRIEFLELNNFEKLCVHFEDSIFDSILLRSKFIDQKYNERLDILIDQEPRITQHYVYGYPNGNKSNLKSVYFFENVDFINDCGVIDKNDFSINREFYLQSQCGNSCLSKKIAFDFNGNICNCPSMDSLLKTQNFEEYYFNSEYISNSKILKEDVEVCKNCEYRHMCIDCRAFTDSTSRPNARPSKCNYNPYIAKWEGEEGYRTLAECGVISNEHTFSIDHEKIAKINAELWPEE